MRSPRGSSRIAAWAGLTLAAVLTTGCASTVAGSAVAAQTGARTSSTSQEPTGTGTGTSEEPTTEASTGPETSANRSSGSQTSEPQTSGTQTADPQTSGGQSSGPTSSGAQTSGTGDPAGWEEYPTKPRALAEFPRTDGAAAIIEAHRLAAYVLVPTDVYPRFSKGGGISTIPMRDAKALALLLPDPTPSVAARSGMYLGFSSSRTDPKTGDSLIIAAFVFPDAAAAQKGAAAMAASTKDDGDVKLTVPGVAGAIGWTRSRDDSAYSHAFVPAGPVVVYSWTDGKPASKAAQPGILGAALAAELKAVAKYKPTAKAKLKDQKYDPLGMYARTLPDKPDDVTVVNGNYPAAASLHFQSNPALSRKNYAAAGVDWVSISRDTLYRAKDAAGAATLQEAFYAEVKAGSPKMETMDPGTAAGNGRCLQDTLAAKYYCVGTSGRFAFEINTESADQMKKSLESQTAMLTG